jgi:hypothetical protein
VENKEPISNDPGETEAIEFEFERAIAESEVELMMALGKHFGLSGVGCNLPILHENCLRCENCDTHNSGVTVRRGPDAPKPRCSACGERLL